MLVRVVKSLTNDKFLQESESASGEVWTLLDGGRQRPTQLWKSGFHAPSQPPIVAHRRPDQPGTDGRQEQRQCGQCQSGTLEIPAGLPVQTECRQPNQGDQQPHAGQGGGQPQLAKSRGQTLNVIIPPVTEAFRNQMPQASGYFDELYRLADSMSFSVLNLFSDVRFNDADFFDVDHLNLSGAKKITSIMRDEV